jgi:hypothetical protein
MTPEEYLKIEAALRAVIDTAETQLAEAREKADNAKHPPLDQLRRAQADDIRRGLIVWHDNGDSGWFWHVVSEPRHYGDDFKAYFADDGCRYGLRGAWVSIAAHPEPIE